RPWRYGTGWIRIAGSETTTWTGSGIDRHSVLGHGTRTGFGTGPGASGTFRAVVLVEAGQALGVGCLCGPSGPSFGSGARGGSVVLLTSLPAEAGRFFPRGSSFLLRSWLPTRINGGGRCTAHRSYISSTDITFRRPGGRSARTWFSPDPTHVRPAPARVWMYGFGDSCERRSALGADRRFLSCSAGVRFLPSLKAGVSSKGFR